MEILLDLNILFSMMIGGFLEILPDIQMGLARTHFSMASVHGLAVVLEKLMNTWQIQCA